MSKQVILGKATVAALAVVVASGCGIKQDVLDAELAQMRDEMRTGDQELADRMDRMDRELGQVSELSDRLQGLESQFEAMQAEFGGQIERMQAAIRFNTPVYFDYDSDQIRPTDRPLLDRFASVVNEYYPGATITVEGFADPAGNATYNINLGLRRADAVKAYLTTSGRLDAQRVRTVSYGEARNRQISPGAFGDRGLVNRRVALVVDYTATSTRPMAARQET